MSLEQLVKEQAKAKEQQRSFLQLQLMLAVLGRQQKKDK